jgi:transposase
VEYFPSYSPELDPTEQAWRVIKKWLSVRFWHNKEILTDQLVQGFKEDFVMVQIYEYVLSNSILCEIMILMGISSHFENE